MHQHDKGVPLAVLWARQRIEELMDRIWEQPHNEPSLRRQVIELAKQYRLSSQFTSFLAVEYRSQAEREQAHGAVTAEIPQYMPQGMGHDKTSLTGQILAPTRSLSEPKREHVQSLQHKLERVRRPRCQITYDVEINGSMQRVELPFVVGVLADLTGHPSPPLPPLVDRRFIPIDRDNFSDVLQKASPRLALQVPNRLADGIDPLSVCLTFRQMEDFEPVRVLDQIPILKQILDARRQLSQTSSPDVRKRVEDIDRKLSRQLNEILHHPNFQRLEATWRGLHHLVYQSETGDQLKIRVLNVSKRDLFKDLEKAVEFDQSALFKKVYEDEYGQLGGEPYGMLVGDYEFSRHPEDINLLKMISNVAAMAHAPFVAAAAPTLFNFDRFTEVTAPRDLAKIFSSVEYAAWKSFRESEDSRYVGLTLPHVLARLPYGENFQRIDEFNFEEFVDDKDHDKYLWMSAIWAFAACVTDAYAKYGWFERICGLDGCGKVEGLLVPLFPTDEGRTPKALSVEMAIDDSRQKELSELGLLPLVFCRDKDAIAFLEARSCHKQKADKEPPAEREFNLNHLLGAARFIHYLVIMTRGKLSWLMECSDFERWFNEWIKNYVHPSSQSPSPAQRSRCPLAEAHVEVRAMKGRPSRYELVVSLRLHTDSDPTVRQRFYAQVRVKI
jgi:type VI secretion system protein ImpC